MLELRIKTFGNVTFGVACEGERVFASGFWESKEEGLFRLKKSLPPNLPWKVAEQPSAFTERALSAVRDVYEGKGIPENLDLALERYPAYTQLVLKTVYRIPVGYVASYGGVAEASGGGPRAVGNVMANNDFWPLVPCHRVVTSSLGLGGYGGGGIRVKYEFLKREKRGYDKPVEVSTEMRPLKVFPVEYVIQKLERFFRK